MIQQLLDRILSVPAPVVLTVVGLVVFVEDALFVGFVVPGETVAILGGVAASLGHVPVAAVLAVVVVAAVVGDTVGFEVGRHFGPRILASRMVRKHGSSVRKAQELLAERGGWAVFLGRWIAFFRAVMPALAGTSGMRYRTFALFNVLGGVAWSVAVVVGGYLAGRSYGVLEKVLGEGVAGVILVGVVVVLVVRHVRKGRRERSDSAREAATDPERTGGAATDADGAGSTAR